MLNGLYRQFVDYVRERDDTLGLLLVGSHASGAATVRSDIDVYIIVSDADPARARAEIIAECERAYGSIRIDVSKQAFQTLDDFSRFAAIGSESEGKRFDLMHARLEFDKTGGALAGLIAERRYLTPQEIDLQLRHHLKDFVRCTCRSVGNNLAGAESAAKLDAAEASSHLIECLHALDGKATPYANYLRRELDDDDLYETIVACAQADIAAQCRLYERIRRAAVDKGFGHVYEVWGDLDTSGAHGTPVIRRWSWHPRRWYYRARHAVRLLLDAHRRLEESGIRHQLQRHLPHFIHYCYRSVQCSRRGNPSAAVLNAANASASLIACLMADRGRLAPANARLRSTLDDDVLHGMILDAAQGDAAAQMELYRRIKLLAVARGFGHVFKGWGAKLAAFETQGNAPA